MQMGNAPPTNPHMNGSNMPITANRPPILPNKNNFMRESQSQHSLRMGNQQQQMMAPSMPNIAHASGYATNISASQSMQNVNQISNNNYPMYQQQFQDQFQMQQQQQQNLMRGAPPKATPEMTEMLKRRAQQMQNGIMHTNSMDNIAMNSHPQQHLQNVNQMPAQQMNKPLNYSAQNVPQSPQKQLPPTAPKPQRQQLDDQPPLPPTSTHPLFKPTQQQPQQPTINYNAAESQKVCTELFFILIL